MRRGEQRLLADGRIYDAAEDQEDPTDRQHGGKGRHNLPRLHVLRLREDRLDLLGALDARCSAPLLRRVLADDLVVSALAPVLDLAHEVVLSWLQLPRRSHEVEHVVEGRRHFSPALGQVRGTEALRSADEGLVGKNDLQQAERIGQLQDVGNEDHQPTHRNRHHVELDLEVQRHANGRRQCGQWPEVLTTRQVLPLAHVRRNDVEAQEQGHEGGDDEHAPVCDPERPQLDVDVAQPVVAKGLHIMHEAEEDADAGVDVVLVVLLLHMLEELEVLRRSVLRDREGVLLAPSIGRELLLHPG
mmetsp:Transcript_18895/g.54664  ORF Transcript_18895/g.54664 Transcript_18895/m.54664 type:complete len:301 (+) Transcript_18895:755-1657(+)